MAISAGRPPALAPYQREKASEMRADGMSWAAIARHFSVDPATVKAAIEGESL
jgi:hypothetical protein